jgi:hypothetical protein
VKVIKRLAGNKWAVGIRGRVLPAVSEVELSPGQRLRALVRVHQGRVTLKISGEASDAIQDLIIRQGLRADALMERIVAAFLRSGLTVAPERLQLAHRLLRRSKLDTKAFTRLLAIVLEKGIDPHSRGLEQLLALLGYGEQESGGRRGGKRQMPTDPEKLARQLQEELEHSGEGEGSSLQVFNHLRGSEHTWIIIPFDYTHEHSGRIFGTIRLRYQPRRQQTDRLIVMARAESGAKWSFLLNNGGEPRLFIFGDPPQKGRKVKAELDVLLLKLQNLGVKSDDTIREDGNFDGFDLPWEELSYRNVDTVH